MSLHQQGSGALTGVLILLAMSAALLHATRGQLATSLALVADERQFIRQFNQAESALAWGKQQSWSGQNAVRECRTERDYGWRACLESITAQRALLRGDSGAGTLAHYQWLEVNEETKIWQTAPHGWIDFCPLTPTERCDKNA